LSELNFKIEINNKHFNVTSPVRGNSINITVLEFYKVCLGLPLWLLTPGTTKPSYAIGCVELKLYLKPLEESKIAWTRTVVTYHTYPELLWKTNSWNA